MRRGRRAVVAAALGLVLVLSAAGCTRLGGGDSHTLDVLVGLNASHLAAQRQYFDTTSREFQRQTGYRINFRTYANSADEQQQLQSAVISGSGPDVFSLGTTFVPTAYATGAFHVLTEADWRTLGGRERFVPQQLTMSGPGGDRQIGVPYATQPFVLAYNTAMFRAAGIAAPPRTWTEFVADARRLTDPAHGVYGVATDPSDGFDPWKYLWMLTLQSGGRLVGDDRHTAHLNSPQVLDAASFWFDWYARYHIVDPRSVTWQGSNALAAFANGRAAMQLMVSANSIPTFAKSAVKGNFGYAPMPTVPYGRTGRPAGGLDAASIVSGQDYAVAQYSPRRDLALKLIRFLTDPARQLEATRLLGDIPGNADAARQAAAADPRLRPFLAAEPHTVPTTFTGAWANLQIDIGTVVAQSLPELAQGRYDRGQLASRLRQLNTQLQAALDQQRKAEREAG